MISQHVPCTQALAQDQRAALEQLLYSCPGLQHVKISTYDGDTPQELRSGTSNSPPYRPSYTHSSNRAHAGHVVIRETSSVIFTNFVSGPRIAVYVYGWQSTYGYSWVLVPRICCMLLSFPTKTNGEGATFSPTLLRFLHSTPRMDVLGS